MLLRLDTVSCQIFGDIQETQFSGSNMEVRVHLKNAFQAYWKPEDLVCLQSLFASHPSPLTSKQAVMTAKEIMLSRRHRQKRW